MTTGSSNCIKHQAPTRVGTGLSLHQGVCQVSLENTTAEMQKKQTYALRENW